MKMKILALLAFAASAVLVSGCGADTGHRKTTGVVTVDGEPIEGATLVFVPAAQGGESGSAITDAKGAYSTVSGSVGEGLKPGDYKVTISKREQVVDEDMAAYEAGEITYDELQERKSKQGLSGGAPVGESLVPEIYSSAADTPLTVTVTDDASKNKFDFDLKFE
ncbi:MAG: carboxypeptidase regulatory-like domain-containing protein [Thermoguttaceae bacterium]|nr:carboxypeptidase regulatory-like domain-containing protein [Thermoguttaceae bacterium]